MRQWLSAAPMLILTACGGGGGGGAAAPAPVPDLSSAPGESALVSYAQAPHQYTLSATSSAGDALQITYSLAPSAGTSTFNGVQGAHSSVKTLTLTKNGTLVTSSVSTTYYLLNPYSPLGYTTSTGTPYQLVTTAAVLPATLTTGSSGTVASDILYHDSTTAIVDADETETYTVTANNASTLYFCVKDVVSNVSSQGAADGLIADSELDCYTVDAGGNVALSYVTLSVGTVSVTFR